MRRPRFSTGAQILYNYGFLLRQTNRKMEAEALETRAKPIRAKQAQQP